MKMTYRPKISVHLANLALKCLNYFYYVKNPCTIRKKSLHKLFDLKQNILNKVDEMKKNDGRKHNNFYAHINNMLKTLSKFGYRVLISTNKTNLYQLICLH